LKLPVSHTAVKDTASYSIGFGANYTYPVNDSWSLTPGLNYGIAGSEELGDVGQVVSGTLTSNYKFYLGRRNGEISLANMIGYYQTLPFKIGEIEANYNISNEVLRNGLMYSKPLNFSLFGYKTSLGVYVSDTRLFGDNLYIEQYNEVGVSLSPTKYTDTQTQNLYGLVLNYLFSSDDANGFSFQASYSF